MRGEGLKVWVVTSNRPIAVTQSLETAKKIVELRAAKLPRKGDVLQMGEWEEKRDKTWIIATVKATKGIWKDHPFYTRYLIQRMKVEQ